MITGILIAHLLSQNGWIRGGSCGMAGHVDCLMLPPIEIRTDVHVHGYSCTADVCGDAALTCEGPCRTTGLECAGHPLPWRMELVAASIAKRIGSEDA